MVREGGGVIMVCVGAGSCVGRGMPAALFIYTLADCTMAHPKPLNHNPTPWLTALTALTALAALQNIRHSLASPTTHAHPAACTHMHT